MQIDPDRFFSMAQAYDQACQYFVPWYDWLQNEVINIINFPVDQSFHIVDLGGGSGHFLEKFLKRFPNSHATWIDFSDDFKKVAEERLSGFFDRVDFYQVKIEEPWESQLKHPADIIVSMSAIHHLTQTNKQQLYQRCFDNLTENGWFFNIDEMKTINDSAYLNSMLYWVRYIDSNPLTIPEHIQPFYKEMQNKHAGWRKRNIEMINIQKEQGDDIHESAFDQVKWLTEAGFKSADLFVKYHLWSIIGGKKNTSE